MTRRIENEDYSGVRFKNINFARAKVVEGFFDGAEFNGYIGSMKVNGLHIWPLIDAEMTRRYPERTKLSPEDPAGCREALEICVSQLEATWQRARALTEEQRRHQMDEEWSIVETVRHLVMVVDGWLGKNILGEDDPFHPIGVTPSFMPRKPEGTSIDPDADPSFEEALDVLNGRLARLSEYVAGLTPDELDRALGLDHAKDVRRAMHVIFDELWSHNRYMDRDIDALETNG